MHPCLTCGACCAHFRVSFHWSEADPDQGVANAVVVGVHDAFAESSVYPNARP